MDRKPARAHVNVLCVFLGQPVDPLAVSMEVIVAELVVHLDEDQQEDKQAEGKAKYVDQCSCRSAPEGDDEPVLEHSEAVAYTVLLRHLTAGKVAGRQQGRCYNAVSGIITCRVHQISVR